MSATRASRTLATLAAEYWDSFLETYPVFATSIGDPRFDDRLSDPTSAGRAAARARFAALLARTGTIDPAALDAEDAITLSALRESLTTEVADFDTGLADWNVDPMEGVPAFFLLLPDYQRLETPEDGAHMVARWREMASYTDQHVARLRRSLADGRVACRAPGDRTLGILEELLDGEVEDWPLLAPLAEVGRLDGWTTTDRERFATGLRDAVTREIRPALLRLRDALVTEILPAARPFERPGMCQVPGGLEGYRLLIRYHTSLDLDPEALHRTGLDEIARIDAELASLAGRTIGAGSLADALTKLRGNPALHFATREEVYQKAATSLARATDAIPGWFGRLPVAP